MRVFYDDLAAARLGHCYLLFDGNAERRAAELEKAAAKASAEPPVAVSEKPNFQELTEALLEIQKPALSGRLRVLIIPYACKITPQGQNKLLKILEEPPVNTLFLLGAEKEDLILITVRSRAKKVWQDVSGSGIFDGGGGNEIERAVRLCLDRLKTSKDVPLAAKMLPDNKAGMLETCTVLEQLFYRELTGSPHNAAESATISAIAHLPAWARERLYQNVSPAAAAEGLLLKIVEGKYKARAT